MIKRLPFLMILAALLLSACGAAATPAPGADQAESRGGASTGFAPPAATTGPELGARASDATTTERLVIKNATLSLVVKDPAASVDSISTLADGLGGFVVSSNVYQTSTDAAGNKIMRAQISIRIPADKFLPAIEQLEGMTVSGKADTKNISGEDVTAQYTDLQSQLRNLEAAEQQLQQIMDSATKTEDVLAVYNQLVSIRGQIEQVKGQMQYYREAAALSLISIDLIPDALSQPIEIGGWKPQCIAKDAIETLVAVLQFLGSLAIYGVLFCLPLGLLFGIPGYFLVR
ncbi:MAG: hypothetical protein HW378_1246, partial [Anaerolineales bacterium]|nr:hypothetical protein [Anaerolineales bacterium]